MLLGLALDACIGLVADCSLCLADNERLGNLAPSTSACGVFLTP